MTTSDVRTAVIDGKTVPVDEFGKQIKHFVPPRKKTFSNISSTDKLFFIDFNNNNGPYGMFSNKYIHPTPLVS